MFKKMVFEDNGDGTTTVTVTQDLGEEVIFLMPGTLDSLEGLVPPEHRERAMEFMEKNAVHIPNDIGGGV